MATIDEIRLAHGGGGRLSHQLIEEVFLPVFGNDYLNPLNDSAVFDAPAGRLAFTTDSFVIDPIFFPGGDIGKLAVCGTVNDLSVAGAEPLFLSTGFILEEGFPLKDLKDIVRSVKNTADEAGMVIVTGDTKVVERGNADGLFINTSGVGRICEGMDISAANAKPGDAVILNGAIGRHGMAVITSRENYGFHTRIESDVAPLNKLVDAMTGVTKKIHVMRDATRGGVATVLNEIAAQSGVGIALQETCLPVTEEVMGACELLGFDPLYVANEGVLVAMVSADAADTVVSAMRSAPYGKDARIIGRVVEDHPGRVVLKTRIGSHRIVDILSGEQLPRIC